MSSKKTTPTESMLEVDEFDLAQLDEDTLRSIIREELDRSILPKINNLYVNICRLERLEDKIDKRF
ncbi:hypothetical protein [Methylobacterium indicum]|uniref:hypothetical protein n=1 Tax=Methylobacterium indicum TaxID=1775910 RepID=UPI002434F6B8|nr:hypothetical protein [Methylobacterium indicum]